MIGAGGAMMAWRLAFWRVLGRGHYPIIEPLPRNTTRPFNRASWEYYRILDNIAAGRAP